MARQIRTCGRIKWNRQRAGNAELEEVAVVLRVRQAHDRCDHDRNIDKLYKATSRL